MNCAVYPRPKTQWPRRRRPLLVRLLRPPRNQIPADTFKRKGETETSGRRDAEGDGHAHLGGVLVEIGLGVCVCLLLQYLMQSCSRGGGTREEPGTLIQGAPVFPGSSRLGIERKTPG